MQINTKYEPGDVVRMSDEYEVIRELSGDFLVVRNTKDEYNVVALKRDLTLVRKAGEKERV